MEVIQSFTIDHTHLKPGIYVSRVDKGFTTFDLRITEPNKEPAVAPAAIHSIEHLMATWFRNSQAKDDVVYVGPMGCLTGMYIAHTNRGSSHDTRDLRQLSPSRPAYVSLGMPPLLGPPQEQLPLGIHEASSHPERRTNFRRCITLAEALQNFNQ